jgi:branched-chain amino acid transport system permease protein
VRIAFDHIDALGGPGGLFLRVAGRDHVDLRAFRGPPAMYYYTILALAAGALALCARLLHRRAGYYWRAIREDEVAAQAVGIDTFWWKMRAVVLSAAMTAIAGVFYAFYYNSLFPEQIFSFTRSIEIILGPVIGGLGTLAGPIVGAVALVLLGDGTTEVLARAGFDIPGVKQIVYGVLLVLVTIYLPNGIWPPVARLLGFEPKRS